MLCIKLLIFGSFNLDTAKSKANDFVLFIFIILLHILFVAR